MEKGSDARGALCSSTSKSGSGDDVNKYANP